MQHIIDAVYENGAFRPLHQESLSIPDGKRVRITIDDGGVPQAIRLATNVYDGLSQADIDEIERIALNRGNFFGTRDQL